MKVHALSTPGIPFLISKKEGLQITFQTLSLRGEVIDTLVRTQFYWNVWHTGYLATGDDLYEIVSGKFNRIPWARGRTDDILYIDVLDGKRYIEVIDETSMILRTNWIDMETNTVVESRRGSDTNQYDPCLIASVDGDRVTIFENDRKVFSEVAHSENVRTEWISEDICLIKGRGFVDFYNHVTRSLASERGLKYYGSLCADRDTLYSKNPGRKGIKVKVLSTNEEMTFYDKKVVTLSFSQGRLLTVFEDGEVLIDQPLRRYRLQKELDNIDEIIDSLSGIGFQVLSVLRENIALDLRKLK
jgi:hypothetical protein